MNCQQSEQLIPLFIEADLDAAEMQQVTTHIETCDSCRNLAAEFQASQSSLHAMSLPAFDEAMMTAMRTAVREKIAPTVSRSSFADWLSPLWNWKLAFAAAAVVLLVSGIVLLRRDAEDKNNPIVKKTNDSVVPAPSSASSQKTPLAQNVFQPRMERKHRATSRVSERNAGKIETNLPSPARATDVDNQIAATTIAPSMNNNDTAPIPLGFIPPPAPQAENQTISFEKTASEPEMIRMEFQTADPNIKIIWLTPKESTRSNPVADTK